MAEAWITFSFFFVFIIAAFAADRWKAHNDKKNSLIEGEEIPVGGDHSGLSQNDWTAIEMYRDLVKDK